jgi:hypothetical protein
LLGWISSRCLEALGEYGWDLNRGQPRLNNAWAMVNRRGHGNRAHLHSNSLFPAWLRHEVEPSSSDEPRVAASFKLGMQAASPDRSGA